MNTVAPKTTEIAQLTSQDERNVFALQLLGDKTRYKIFKQLITDQNMCVSEIAAHVGLTTSAVSQHFRSFEMIGLVDKTRHAQKICYQLKFNDPLVKQLISITNSQ